MKESPTVNIWKGMRRGGVPIIHIRHLVDYHISGLKSLPDTTEGKSEELDACHQYLKELNIEENDVKENAR